MNRVPAAIWVAGLTGWLVLSFVTALQIDMGGLYGGTGVLIGPAVLWVFLGNLFWPLVLPLMVRVTRRWPPRVGNLRYTLPGHLLLGLLFAVGHGLFATALAYAIGPFPELTGAMFTAALGTYLAIGLHLELVVYFGLLGAIVAWRAHREIQERTLRSADLEVQLSRSRLSALQSRIQPHFFFNSLNTVAMMVRGGEGSAAVQTLSDLGDLMRDALCDPESAESTLAEEIRLVERYLAVEGARFSDRLTWDIEVDAAVGDVPMPPLLLQPLVENAVRHGVAKAPSTGRIDVRARRDRTGEVDTFVLEVSDDGPGPATTERGQGMGLANTRARIDAFYGGGTLDLEREAGRTVARIRIPWARTEDG